MCSVNFKHWCVSGRAAVCPRAAARPVTPSFNLSIPRRSPRDHSIQHSTSSAQALLFTILHLPTSIQVCGLIKERTL